MDFNSDGFKSYLKELPPKDSSKIVDYISLRDHYVRYILFKSCAEYISTITSNNAMSRPMAS